MLSTVALVFVSFLLHDSWALAGPVLVTGGAGYIGSHTCLELLQQNPHQRVIVVDNLDNSSEESLKRVQELVADASDDRLVFRNCDLRDTSRLEEVLDEFPDIDSCIHFAGLKAVGESVAEPLRYYDCNVGGTLSLLQALERRKIHKFVFSSSATVYGNPDQLPIPETARLQATNPYGRTKLFIEEILRDVYAAHPDQWKIFILRYFNPIGAHPSGRIGEDPQGIPNNLMPFIAQVCVGRRDKLSVFGDDYDTPDGTGVRDYIHVVDLAKGHVAALAAMDKPPKSEAGFCQAVNLGTGTGVSVLQLVDGMRKASGQAIPTVIAGRRPGDVASVYADPSVAHSVLKPWKAELGVAEMCADTWKWQSENPYGYQQQADEDEEQAVEIAVEEEQTEKASV